MGVPEGLAKGSEYHLLGGLKVAGITADEDIRIRVADAQGQLFTMNRGEWQAISVPAGHSDGPSTKVKSAKGGISIRGVREIPGDGQREDIGDRRG